MITIGKLYTVTLANSVRVCADIQTNERNFTLWYETGFTYSQYLCTERCDSFVVVLLPLAFRTGQDIHCNDPLSAQLYYQLTQYYIPVVSKHHTKHAFSIHATLSHERLPSAQAVGTGFSGGVDSMYTLASHGPDSVYPITHLCTFNMGPFEKKEETPKHFTRSYERITALAKELNLASVWLNTNFVSALEELFVHVELFRNTAAALALQKLFSVYFHSASRSIDKFSLADQAGYDGHGFFCRRHVLH